MLDRKLIEDKMKERGFVVYSTIGSTNLQFISEHMYDFNYEEKTSPRQRKPVINIIVNLRNEEFECFYNLSKSINQLKSPKCSPIMSDEHFDKIVTRFETEAKWLSRLTE